MRNKKSMVENQLERRLGELRYGDHLCMVYESRAEQMAVAVPFIKHGLAAGQRCAYIADDQTVEDVIDALTAKGVDVAQAQARGALFLLTKRDAYLRSGRFDPHEMIAFLRQTSEQALAEGFSGFRVAGEMTWALGPETGCDRLIEYEALINDFFPNSRALALCQYNRQRFSPAIIRDVLRTHPLAIFGDQVCSNLYYEPPHLILGDGEDDSQRIGERVDWMISQLRRSERGIAARKQAEEALRQREEHLRAVVETTPECIKVVAAEGTLVEMNPMGLSMVEADQEENALGRSIYDLIAEEYRPVYRAFHERICRGEKGTLEFEIVGLRGTRRRMETHAAPLRGPDGTLMQLAITHDVTERKQAEEELRYQHGLLRTITDTALTAIFMTDEEGRCTFMNPAAEAMIGCSFEKAEGRVLHDLVHPRRPDGSPYAVEQCPLHQALPENFEVRGQEDLFVRRDGTFFPVMCNARPIIKRGVPVGTVLEVRDITKEKETEETLRRQAQELTEADRRKDEFLATLAHELRNPLAPIRTGLELLRVAGDDPALVEETRSTMERQAQQLVRLVDDLLDVSRITRGKIELRRCRVELASIVQSAIEAVQPFIAELGHTLTVGLPPEPIFVNADPARLAQVIANLLNNAAKYTLRGGQIRLTAERQGSTAVLRVEDTGIGIPAEMLDRIFEMFTQMDGALERADGGLGIGLTLVKRLVEMHGGTVEAESEGENQGSAFTVRLPLIAPRSAHARDSNGEAHDAAPKRHILIVDDNLDAAKMLGMVLKALGNKISMAADGLEAVRAAETLRPDVVLMDLGMPRLNGYDAARRIREQPWGQEILLVALTGWGQQEDRNRTKTAGFDHHLVKPVEPTTLQKLLAEVPVGGDLDVLTRSNHP